MAVAPRLQNLAGKWQIPLLAVSVTLVVAGLLELRPAPRQVSADDILAAARLELKAERFEQVSRTLTTLLDEQDLKTSQRGEAHHLLADTIWQAESSRYRHDLENARRILINFALSRQLGFPLQEADTFKNAQAADWLGMTDEAVDAYSQALDAAGADRLGILQRLIEILLSAATRDWPRIDGYMDQLLRQAGDHPDVLLRAVQWKMQRLLAEEDIAAADGLLADVEGRLDVPPWSDSLSVMRAQILFRQEQYEAAEGRLRSLQGSLRRADPLYAEAGWLLGRINYIESRPQIALTFYDEVVRTQPDSEYGLASQVGKAEALAVLERYDASADSYHLAVESLRQHHGSLLIDEAAIRQSLRMLAIVLSRNDRPQEALPFAEMAAELAEPGQDEALAELLELQARIHVQAAEGLNGGREEPRPLLRADADGSAAHDESPATGTQPAAAGESAPPDPRDRARLHLSQAAELYIRVAGLRVLQVALSQEAAWQSARCFERAGRVDRAVEAFQDFIREYPNGEYAPEALHRLGAAQQSLGRIDEAIHTYEQLLTRFERTPAAFASLVPLGRCHVALGVGHYETAEKVFLSIVQEDPSHAPLFTPLAPEFRESLLELANLYLRWDRPERAIERLEQALALYGNDPDLTRIQYQLGDGYRRSGLKLLAEAAGMKQPMLAEGPRQEAGRRLERARDLFDRVASRLDAASGPLDATERIYLRTSYVYRADCAFDTGQFALAADLYGRVAWRWQSDPIALAAYVQIVRSYLAAGNAEAAGSALARARWVLRTIPDGQFNQPPDLRTRAYWTQLFDWMEQSGLVATNGGQQAGA